MFDCKIELDMQVLRKNLSHFVTAELNKYNDRQLSIKLIYSQIAFLTQVRPIALDNLIKIGTEIIGLENIDVQATYQKGNCFYIVLKQINIQFRNLSNDEVDILNSFNGH